MNDLRREYIHLVTRWNDLSLTRERLYDELAVFEETRAGRPVREGEAEFRRHLQATMNESMSVAYRAEQITQIPVVFGRPRRRKKMLDAQHRWFRNITDLKAAQSELDRILARA